MGLYKSVKNRAVNYIISHSNSSVSQNLKNAYNRFKTLNKPRSYHNGRYIGQHIGDAFFKYINKSKSSPNKKTPFQKGIKNGISKSAVYWIPGIAVRGAKKRTNKIIKRATKIRGVENIHRLFRNTPTPSIRY